MNMNHRFRWDVLNRHWHCSQCGAIEHEALLGAMQEIVGDSDSYEWSPTLQHPDRADRLICPAATQADA